jgi:hypothetical protein
MLACLPRAAGLGTYGNQTYERLPVIGTNRGVSYRLYMPPGSAAVMAMAPAPNTAAGRK